MEALMSTPKLYDLLSVKIGKPTAEALLVFIKGGIKDEMEYQIKALATNENLFKVKGTLKDEINAVQIALQKDISAVHKELKDEISAVRTELKEEISVVRTELKEEISAVRVELKEDISNLDVKLTKEMSELRVNVEKGFKQQFWLLLVLFLPFYFSVILLLFRLL